MYGLLNQTMISSGENVGKTINIGIVDDHRIFLEGISLLIKDMSQDYSVECFFSPLDILPSLENTLRFDLLICDLIMSSMNGLAFISTVRERSKTLPILMISGIATSPPVQDMRRLGGNGFVHKSASNDRLRTAIQSVLSGQPYFVDGLGDSLDEIGPRGNAEDIHPADEITILPRLPPRQLEVLRFIANGATNKDIAALMTISENTVKTHLKQIFQALGVNKRTACVRKAQILGII